MTSLQPNISKLSVACKVVWTGLEILVGSETGQECLALEATVVYKRLV